MKLPLPLRSHSCFLNIPVIFLTFSAVLAAAFSMGCGTSGSSGPPPLSGNTSVTVLLSSTANDQLSQFEIDFNSVSLTSASGKTVNLFTTGQNPEFIHLNGRAEPLLTVSVPQDVYTSATATIGGSLFTCMALDPSSGNLVIDMFGYGSTPSSQVTVNVPTPITITGNAMGLSLDMLVSQSATYPNCYSGGAFSITPTFNLTPVAFSAQVAEPLLDGQIASVNAADNSFTIALAGGQMSGPNSANGQTLSVNSNDSTVYQGISGFSALTVGTFVDMDAAIQEDGSQLATRIAVEDTDVTDLTVSTGPLLQVAASVPVLFGFGRQDQGYLWTWIDGEAGNFMPYSFGSAAFQISGRFTNLPSLPFVASFDAANMFDGQNVYVTTHATTELPDPTYFPATTITLIPQTINGTINGISSDGNFTTYSATLAPYDLIPALSVQQGQNTVLTDPSNVVVYVDLNTQMLNSQTLAVGSVARFNGMLFNDAGTLRMDCGQVNDGVAVQSQTQAAFTGRASYPTQRGIVVHRYLQKPDVSK